MFEINSHSDYVKTCLVMGAFIAGGMWYFDRPVEHAPTAAPVSGQTEIVVNAGIYDTHYSLTNSIDEPFLVTSIYPTRKRTNPLSDSHSEFVTFSPRATQSYMKKYAGMTHCPASFLNRHADHISLYAADKIIAKRLAGWNRKDGSKVSSWEIVNITGQCLGKRTKIEKNGVDVTDTTKLRVIGRKASRDCHMIYVTGITPTDMALQDYVTGSL